MYKIIGPDGKEYGPVTAEQMRQWVDEGRANAQTQVLAEGDVEWRPLSMFAELVGEAEASLHEGESTMSAPAVIQSKTSGMAITGMVMGILGIVTCYCGLLFALLGVIFSGVAISQINKNPAHLTGKGMAIAGLVTSIVALAIDSIWLIVYWAVIMTAIAQHKM
ncbi:MAG: DUF4190 domain-containing protein [Verrucomicrobiia bacterium]